MRHAVIAAIVVLFLTAAITRSPAVLPAVYLLAGAFAVAAWWGARSIKSIELKRRMDARAFLGETVPVTLEVRNRSALPVAWLDVRDQIPVDVRSESFRRALALGPRESRRFDYVIHAARRGLYEIGPLVVNTGDPIGLSGLKARDEQPAFLTIYPRIVALPRLRLPSRSPFGHLRHSQPIYEDPSRLRGKREYRTGDSLRTVDWKTTAITGRLQVKQYEPSIALEAMVFLDLNTAKYGRGWIDGTELAIVVCASLANRVIAQHGEVGVATNGLDPIITAGAGAANEDVPIALRRTRPFAPVPPGKGHAQLMRVLDVLARVKAAPPPGKQIAPETDDDFCALIRRRRPELSWGTTLIAVTGGASDELFDELFEARRAGLSVMLVLCGEVDPSRALKVAGQFGIAAYHLHKERDLETWTNAQRP